MKKKTLVKCLLILLPVLAVGLATTGDSVLVYDAQAGVTKYFSYFATEPVTQVQMLLPLAAMLCLASGVCGAVYLVKKKEWSLNAVIWTSLLAACAAAAPTVMQGDVKVVANVGLPIFMVIDWLVASYIQKHPEQFEEEKTKKGKRLTGN